MHSAFAGIQLGPFNTAYHRRVVDQRFREALGAYLERELLPQVDEPFERTEGRLTAEVNEERFCGPHSAVKDIYRLEFSFIREGSADTITAEIRYYPDTNCFRVRRAHQPLILWTAKREKAARAYCAAIDDTVARITGGEKGEWKCPACGGALKLVDSPNLFDLACPRGCFVYNFHRVPGTTQYRSGHFFTRFFGPGSEEEG